MSYIRLLLFCFLPKVLFAQSNPTKGIQFIHENWQTALDSAKKYEKLIFLDAYTTWCAPCKAMNRDVFTHPKISRFYNEQFINVKMDMEKGDGLALAQAYQIKAYPTFLFINATGKAVHRAVGFQEIDVFLQLGKAALNQEDRLDAWNNRFATGNRDALFLRNYIQKLSDAQDPKCIKIVETYLNTQTDWRSQAHLGLIYRMVETTDTPLYRFLVENKDTFQNIFGKYDIEIKIQNLLTDKLHNEKALPPLPIADSLIALTYPKKAKRMIPNYQMTYYRLKGDRTNYANAAVQYFKQFEDSAEELNETAQTFYEVVDDPKMLKKAVKWAKRALQKEKKQLYFLTLAQLYVKMGEERCAQKVLNNAIEHGKESGERHDEASELLKTIQ
jgi:thiol-disulfide isomerase/thioredoxin